MTHTEDLIRLRETEVKYLRNRIQELEALIEVYQSQLELDLQNENR